MVTFYSCFNLLNALKILKYENLEFISHMPIASWIVRFVECMGKVAVAQPRLSLGGPIPSHNGPNSQPVKAERLVNWHHIGPSGLIFATHSKGKIPSHK